MKYPGHENDKVDSETGFLGVASLKMNFSLVIPLRHMFNSEGKEQLK